MTSFYVTKDDFEAFLDIVEAKWTREPDYNRARYNASFKMSTGVEVRIEVQSVDIHPDGKVFYGRRDAWTHVRFSTWIHENVSLTGKGSRGEESAVELWNTLSILG